MSSDRFCGSVSSKWDITSRAHEGVSKRVDPGYETIGEMVGKPVEMEDLRRAWAWKSLLAADDFRRGLKKEGRRGDIGGGAPEVSAELIVVGSGDAATTEARRESGLAGCSRAVSFSIWPVVM